jgi:hypothetical protein
VVVGQATNNGVKLIILICKNLRYLREMYLPPLLVA